MDAADLIARVRQSAPAARVDDGAAVDGQPTVHAGADDAIAVLRALRDLPASPFDVLAELTAVDYRPREPRFELIYLLLSTPARARLRVKVALPGADPHVPTACAIWPGANWLEREVWDMFGIAFDGHPDPRRLLMPEDWEGFPLRKDYPVQVRMKPKTGEAMQISEEEFRANLLRDRLSRP